MSPAIATSHLIKLFPLCNLMLRNNCKYIFTLAPVAPYVKVIFYFTGFCDTSNLNLLNGATFSGGCTTQCTHLTNGASYQINCTNPSYDVIDSNGTDVGPSGSYAVDCMPTNNGLWAPGTLYCAPGMMSA